jgi:murein DD-endopeptidase MepM/ murein hydrolase activator NlpD
MIEYTIERGDTVYDIAQRFGLTQESIAWSNDRRSLWTLTPGSTLKIPPVDGVIHVAVGSATIADIADLYQIDDPMLIIESEANQLEGLDPSTVPPSGMEIFIPGGIAEEINWAPPVVTGSSSGGSGPGGSPGTVSFEPGAPGSCAPMPPGAGTAWGAPMNRGSYTITRGYSDWHPGIDLAAPTGTPIFAANGGTVIFAGRSNWGYGLAVVISSGPFFTLYGHMSQVNVSCGQVVGTGQQIGAVGSTGNSSGPHLHFEILYGSTRTNPSSTIGF